MADGVPSVASLSCLLDDGRRVWARSEDPDLLAEMLSRETCGREAVVKGHALIGI